MQTKTTNLLKKFSPSRDIVFYIAQKDLVDHYKHIDPIDGLVIVPLEKAHGRRLFVEIQCNFRYGPEAEEFSNIAFKKTVTIAYCELFPFGNHNNGNNEAPQTLKPWQVAMMKKIGHPLAVCPFTLEFPQGTAPSLVTANPEGVSGEPCGLTYQVMAYFCTDPALPLQKKDTAAFKVRIVQEQLPAQAIEQLSLAPTTRPATLVSRQFFLAPGKLQIEMCLDKAIYYLGDKLVMNVVINNSSNRAIRKIKCKLYQVSQVTFASGMRRVPIYVHETVDGCPIQPGATLQRSYTMMTKLQPHISTNNLVFEASTARYEEFERMASTTIFPYTDPKEGFAILVSYEAKIKVYLGSVHVQGFSDVSATVPFFLFHEPSNNKVSSEAEIIPTAMPASKPPRMIRLTSVEMNNVNSPLDGPQEPLLAW